MEAEQSSLGAILLEPSYAIPVVMGLLNEDDYFHQTHKSIFRAVCKLHKGQTAIDLNTVIDAVKPVDFSSVGGIGYLAELTDNTPTARNVGYYAKIVKRESERRKRILRAVGDIEHALDDNNAVTPGKTFTTMKEVLDSVVDEMFETTGQRLSGVSTGIDGFDDFFDGLQKGKLYIIAGRPSMGKSLISTQIAANIKLEGGKIAFFPLEVGAKTFTRNMLSNISGVEVWKYRKGRGDRHSDMDKEMMYDGLSKLIEGQIFLGEKNTPFGVEEVLKEVLAETGTLDAVFIDHLQEMKSDNKQVNRNYQLEDALKEIRRIARDYDVPIILAAQIGRGSEKENREPTIADIRDSGSIEQIADVIILLHGKREEMSRVAKVAKNREGATGQIRITLRPECLRAKEEVDYANN
jgi:replicative DNA helicase